MVLDIALSVDATSLAHTGELFLSPVWRGCAWVCTLVYIRHIPSVRLIFELLCCYLSAVLEYLLHQSL